MKKLKLAASFLQFPVFMYGSAYLFQHIYRGDWYFLPTQIIALLLGVASLAVLIFTVVDYFRN